MVGAAVVAEVVAAWILTASVMMLFVLVNNLTSSTS